MSYPPIRSVAIAASLRSAYCAQQAALVKPSRTLSLSKGTAVLMEGPGDEASSPSPASMHYPTVVWAATGDRSHSIAELSLRTQNAERRSGGDASSPSPASRERGPGGEGLLRASPSDSRRRTR